jgi:hypothetical protein
MCGYCKYHVGFFDEIDGEYIDDGCLCHHKKADEEGYHLKCCFEYEDKPEDNCPYFEDRLKEV